jgi:molecular chaperone GrpE
MQDNEKSRPAGDDPKPQAVEGEAEAAEAETQSADSENEAVDSRDQRIAELEAELASAKDQQLRALADVENMRRRAQREREEALKYGAVSLARDLLSVADNLGRALAAAPADGADEATKSLIEGVAMVEKDLASALEKHNVQQVAGVGEPFDHNVHQAVVEIEAPDVPEGHVAQVLQTGYILHDRLLRPAMVAVSKGSGN